MKDKKVVLQSLLCFALVVSLILPVAVAGASQASAQVADERSLLHRSADGCSASSAMPLTTEQGQVAPMVSAGYRHTVGLRFDGTVVALGDNDSGQCDVGDWTDIVQVSAGRDHTVWIKSDGTVVAVGESNSGQCDVGDWTDIVQVAAGNWHTVGLKSDGGAVAVGHNWHGQCDVGDWTDIAQVAAGDEHTVGLKSDGSAVAAGREVELAKWNLGVTAPPPTEIWDWYGLNATRDDLGGSYVLMCDLDSSTAGYDELAGPTANEGAGWEPIGQYGTWPDHEGRFGGTFDGQGYEIRDLFINRFGASYVGLFGYVDDGGVIQDVGVLNATVTGYSEVGALVGDNRGTVSDSYSGGNVTGFPAVGGLVGHDSGAVDNSHSIASVASHEWGAGGLVGWNGGTVSNSRSSGSVTGYEYVGGLVGANVDTVVNSYSTGSVSGVGDVGGLVGVNSGTVSNSYSSGRATGVVYVGGLVGLNVGTLSNSFWDVETSGIEVSDGGTGKTTAGMQDIATFTDTATEGLDDPWDVTAVLFGETDDAYIWNIVDGKTYPFLSWEQVHDASGWSVPMAADAGEDGANADLEFGIHPDATDGYDSGIDLPAPPAGPGALFDACFSIVDPFFSTLNKDFRGEIPNQWTLEVWSTSEDIALSWDAAAIPSELSAIMDTDIEKIDMKAQAGVVLPAGEYTITISVSYELEIELSLKAGWNLVSVPVVPADPSVGIVFAGTEAVFAWDPATRIYYTLGDVEPHRGYWVAVTADTVITVSGVPVYTWTAEISAGWNLIGSVICDVDFTVPDTDPAGKIEPFSYRWDPATRIYDYSTTVEPQMGHWVAATEDCQLTLCCTGLSAVEG